MSDLLATRVQRSGGSFAPPIDEAKMASYEALANTAEPRVKDSMLSLLKMVKAWWDLPESTKEGQPHLALPLRAAVVPLEDQHIADLDALVPWPDELKLLSNAEETGVFDKLTGDLRNAAFHLLWFAGELTLDREPISMDKLA